MNLSRLFAEVGDDPEAVKLLESAIQINPDYFPAYYNIVVACSRMGKPNDGIAFLRAYLERNPKDYQNVKELLRKMNIALD